MLTFIFFIFLSIGVSIINGDTCQCCFSWQTEGCQVPSIYIPCEDCTSFFCANHVKGCQGTPPCRAECIHDSSSTTTKASSSYPPTETTTTVTTSTTTTTVASAGYFIRSELFVIFASWTLLTVCRLSL